MKQSTKGALLSGLVFPGLGQLIHKHKARGFGFMAAVLACIVVIIVKATELAQASLQQMQAEGKAITDEAVQQAAQQAMHNPASQTLSLALIALLICWLASIVDAWMVGNKLDKQS